MVITVFMKKTQRVQAAEASRKDVLRGRLQVRECW